MFTNKRLKKLADLRERAGLSQRAMAAKVGVALIVYQRYEWGINVPGIRRANLIAEILGIDNPKDIWGN